MAKKLRLTLRDERVKVVAHFQEEGSVLKGNRSGTCEGFEITLAIEADEAPEQVVRLLKMAHQLCFTEHALTDTIPLIQRHTLNGQPINL